jgi:DNA-binding TFAR19-related protein (PDSD5 family)
MRKAMAALARPEAAQTIASLLISMAQNSGISAADQEKVTWSA